MSYLHQGRRTSVTRGQVASRTAGTTAGTGRPSVGANLNNNNNNKTATSSQQQSAHPARPNSNPPTVEFQLSKKTAELTMIVQMLFTQLHTKEAECEMWQRYYNEFGDTILRELGDEKTQTVALRSQIEALNNALTKAVEEVQRRAKEGEKFKADCTHAQERSQNLQNLFNESVAEKNGLHVELASVKNQLETQKEICTNLQNELSKVAAQAKGSEKRERLALTRLEKEIATLQTENANLTTEFAHMKAYADDLVSLREKAEEDRRIVTATLDSLRAEYLSLKEKHDAVRAAPFVNPMTQLKQDEEMRRQRLASARKNLKSASVQAEEPTMDTELVQLRRELQRYKLELKNRDSSFNRMFAAAQMRGSKNGNLVTTAQVEYGDDDGDDGQSDDGGGGGGGGLSLNASAVPRQPHPNSKAASSSSTLQRRQPSNTSRRVPLMPAQFSSSSSSQQNSNSNSSVRRSFGSSAKPTTFPPV